MAHKYSFKDLGQSRSELTITEIDEKVLEEARKKALDEYSKNMKIKGFRPGKIPHEMVMEQIGEQQLHAVSLEHALPVAANEIAAQENLRVVGQPKVNFESLEPLKIVVEFDLYPTISVGKYEKINVKVDKKEASDKEVDAAIEEMQKRTQEYQEVDRASKDGDRVELDFEGFDTDGKAIPNTASQNHPLILGSKMMIPGFEEALVGVKAGEEKSFDVTFPKDYHAEDMANKKITFKVKIHKVEEVKDQPVDEAFVEKLTGEKMKVEDWKKQLKEQIQKEHDQQSKRQLEDSYYDELIKLTAGDIPQSMIEMEKEAILKELKQQILYQGLSYEKYLQTMGKNEEELLATYDKPATDRIKLRLALRDIADKEGVEVSDEDTQKHLEEMMGRYPESQREQFKDLYKPGTDSYYALQHQLKMQKTLEKILPKV